MEPQLQIWLFGEFRVLFNHKPLLDADSPRLQSFFAYLVLHQGVPIPKQELASLFWPETGESQARTNLRRLLFRLRRHWIDFDRYLTSTEYSLNWNPGQPVGCDVNEFERSVLAWKQAQSRGERLMLLERAASLCKGDLFPGCYDDWITSKRDAFGQQFIEVIEDLIHTEEAKGNYAAGIRFAEQLRNRDLLYEPIYLALMRLHLKNGNRSGALEIYQNCCQVFQKELNVSPGPEIQSFHQVIMHLEMLATPRSQGIGVISFVGRENEWELLHQEWSKAAAEPTVVIIKGETGIGKSRLAEEFARWVQSQDFEARSTRCYALEGSMAYVPVANWLLDPYQKQKKGLEPVRLRELARILPSILSEFPQIEPPLSMVESWQRVQFFEALTKTLLYPQSWGQSRLLLVMDDLQWCDAETLQWLHYLVRFDPHQPLLILGTYRIEEFVQNSALDQLIQNLRSEGKLLEIELTGLSQKSSAALAAQILNQSLDVKTSDRLFTKTSGNPLYVVEVARTWDTHHPEQSSRLQGIIEARLAQFSGMDADVLDTAAVIGREFGWDLIATSSVIAEEDLTHSLGKLIEKRILHVRRENAVDFIHDQIREVAYDRIPTLRRRSLHRQVAKAIQKTCAEAKAVSEHLLDVNSAQIAVHYEKAGSLYQAFQFYARAAGYASRIYAHQESQALYASAIHLARQLNWPGPQLARLYAARGRALEHLGCFPEAVQVYINLEMLAGEQNDPEMQCVALSRQAACYIEPSGVHDPAAARLLLAKGLAIARAIGAYELEAQMLWVQLVNANHYGKPEEGREAAESCLAVARDHALEDSLAVCLHDFALNLRLCGDSAYGNACAEESRAIFRENGNLSMLVDSLNQQAWIDYLQLKFDSAEEYVLEAAQISGSIQNKWNQAYASWIQAMLNEAQGNWKAALAYCEESLIVGQEVGFLMSLTSLKLLYGDLLRRMGQLDRAILVHLEALEASRMQASFLLFASQAQVALDYFESGDLAAGERYLGDARMSGLVGVVGPCIGLPYLSRALVEWASRSGKWQAALADIKPILAEIRRRNLPINQVQVEYDYACCLEGAGQFDEAEAIFLSIRPKVEESRFHRLLGQIDLALAAHFERQGRFEQQIIYMQTTRWGNDSIQ